MDVQATVKVAASPLDLLPLCLLAWCFLVLGRTGPHHTTWSRPDALPSAGVHLTQIRDANSEIVRRCKSQALSEFLIS